MRIAVTSQNLKDITGHAGKCRRFWIYESGGTAPLDRRLVEIGLEETFHASHGGLASALAGIDVLITASMGGRLQDYLKQQGITPVVTLEASPDIAVTAFLNGHLEIQAGSGHACHGHH